MIGQSSSKMRRSYSKWSFSAAPEWPAAMGSTATAQNCRHRSPSAATGATIWSVIRCPSSGKVV
jgi:hypothetical protein